MPEGESRSQQQQPQQQPLPPPYALALLACDMIHKDPATGKHFLLGTFANIVASAFPVTHPVVAVYAALTNGHGRVPLRFLLTDVDEARPPVAQGELEVEFDDPRTVVEIALFWPGVVFPEPGEYRLQMLAAGEFLLERRILLAPAKAEVS